MQGDLPRFEQFSVNRTKPVNLENTDEHMFLHEISRDFPAVVIQKLNNIRIAHNAIFYKNGIVNNSLTAPNNQPKHLVSKIKFLLSYQVFKSALDVDQSVIWITDNSSIGYFHWFGDALPRLISLGSQFVESTIYLPKSYEQRDYIVESLALFNYPVSFYEDHEILNVKELIFSPLRAPTGNFNEVNIREMRDFLLSKLELNPSPITNDRIYVTRGKAAKRKILNEDAVMIEMKKQGFEIVDWEDHTWKEQVAIARQARYIVSIHGAGLTNMLFMKPGASVLELRLADCGRTNCYFSLASALYIPYYYQGCSGDSNIPNKANLTVEIQRLKSNVEMMLGE